MNQSSNNMAISYLKEFWFSLLAPWAHKFFGSLRGLLSLGSSIPQESPVCGVKDRKRPHASLGLWHKVLQQIKSEAILPSDITSREDHSLAAFVGDKLLGASLAKWVKEQNKLQKEKKRQEQQEQPPPGEDLASAAEPKKRESFPYCNEGSATKLASVVLSNKFMAERISQILPDPSFREWEKQFEYNNHSLATVVEAAVAAVYDLDVDAVDDLVEWLIQEGERCEKRILGECMLFNAKGRLLELGGSLSVEREGGVDHDPIFLANAALKNKIFSATAVGNNKRDAEENAASQCVVYHLCEGNVKDRLLGLGGTIAVDPEKDDSTKFCAKAHLGDYNAEAMGESERAAEDQAATKCLVQHWHESNAASSSYEVLKERIKNEKPPSDTWIPFEYSNDDMKVHNKESYLEWWEQGAQKGKEAHRRAYFAPKVFPGTVLSVNSWTRRQNEGGDADAEESASVLVVIVFKTRDGSGVKNWSCTHTASSNNKARMAVGLQANEEISKFMLAVGEEVAALGEEVAALA